MKQVALFIQFFSLLFLDPGIILLISPLPMTSITYLPAPFKLLRAVRRTTVLNILFEINKHANDFHCKGVSFHFHFTNSRDYIPDKFYIICLSVNDLPQNKQFIMIPTLWHLKIAIVQKGDSISYNNSQLDRERYFLPSSAVMIINTALTPA